MIRLRFWFTFVVDLFRVISRRRARLAQDRFDERQHQLAMVRELVQGFVDLAKANQDGLLEVAKAQTKQAEAFQQWLKGFQSTPGELPPSSSITDKDEWLLEQQKLAAAGDVDALTNLPPEFQLALALEKLNHENLGDFDREGRDFPNP